MKLTILRVISILLIAVALGLYGYGVLVKGESPTENLLRTAVIALSGLSALMKARPKRRPLNAYAEGYAKELGSAFQEDPDKRQKLLEAIRFFDEDKYPAAMKQLDALRPAALTRDAQYAVGLFTALCQTDLGLNEAAAATYEELANKGIATSQLYSNLASRYLALDQLEKAGEAGLKAVELDPENAAAHINLGNILMTMGAYAEAENAAAHACALKPERFQAWTLLAIAQAVLGKDETEAFQQAVRTGQDGEALRAAIVHYVQKAKASA